MNDKTKTLLALTTSALVGSAHAAVVYSNETFEGGTVNYTINHTAEVGGVAEVGTLTQLQDGGVNISAETAFTNTAFKENSPSLMGILASGEPTNFTPGGSVPGGKHAFVSNSANRHLRLATPMPLVADGVTSLSISFDYMMYGLGTADFIHTFELAYSALGTFADAVQIATFTPSLSTPQDTWLTANVSITSADVTFEDGANIRINKLAPQATSQIVLLDNIVITGVPEPTTALLGGIGMLALLRRRRN